MAMVQHQGQRALSLQTLPSARMLLELKNDFFLLVFQEILDEPRCGLYRTGLIYVNLQNKQTNKTHIWGLTVSKEAGKGEMVPELLS